MLSHLCSYALSCEYRRASVYPYDLTSVVAHSAMVPQVWLQEEGPDQTHNLQPAPAHCTPAAPASRTYYGLMELFSLFTLTENYPVYIPEGV